MVVDHVRRDATGPELAERLEPVVPVQDHEVPVRDEDGTLQVPVHADLVPDPVQEIRLDPLVTPQKAQIEEDGARQRRSRSFFLGTHVVRIGARVINLPPVIRRV